MPITPKRRGRPSKAAPVVETPAVAQPIEPQVLPVPVEPEAAAVPAAHETATPDTVAPIAVKLGSVKGVLHLVPLGTILGVLADVFGARLETLQGTASILAQVDRVRDTEGRCAPIIFTRGQHGSHSLLAGIETVAAAMAARLENVAVILIEQGDANEAQSWLVGCRQKSQELPFRFVVSEVFSVIE